MAQNKPHQNSIYFLIFVIIMIGIFITNQWINGQIEEMNQLSPSSEVAMTETKPKSDDSEAETNVGTASSDFSVAASQEVSVSTSILRKENQDKQPEAIIYELPLKDDLLPQ